MKATVEVVCYKSKPLKDGTFPLMLRVTKDRKRKYVSLGLSLHEKFWDFEKGKPKRNCPNKEQIERLIAAKTAEYNDLILEMTSQQREYTVETPGAATRGARRIITGGNPPVVYYYTDDHYRSFRRFTVP